MADIYTKADFYRSYRRRLHIQCIYTETFLIDSEYLVFYFYIENGVSAAVPWTIQRPSNSYAYGLHPKKKPGTTRGSGKNLLKRFNPNNKIELFGCVQRKSFYLSFLFCCCCCCCCCFCSTDCCYIYLYFCLLLLLLLKGHQFRWWVQRFKWTPLRWRRTFAGAKGIRSLWHWLLSQNKRKPWKTPGRHERGGQNWGNQDEMDHFAALKNQG